MLFCGIDLHSNNCFVVISDDDDRVLYSRRLPNNLDQICAALDPYRTNLFGVVVESTYNWYWLVDGLIDAGYPLHLANTTAIKQYDGLKHRGDESDARHLAHILRDCCLKVISCLGLRVQFVTSRASVCSWFSSVRRRSYRSKPVWRSKPEDVSPLTP
jgi:transposase